MISGWFTLSNCTRHTVDITGDSQTHIKFESIGKRGQCEVTLKTYRDDRLMVFFDNLNISGSLIDTWLELHDGTSRGSPYIGDIKYGGPIAPSDVYTTNGQFLTVYFQDNLSGRPSDFSLWITSFHTGICDSDEYKCDNGRCIDRGLVCFGSNPCGDNSDCKYRFKFTEPVIAGMVVGGVVLTILVVAVLSACYKRNGRHQKTAMVTVRSSLVKAAVPVSKSSYGYKLPVPQYLEPPPYPGNTGTASNSTTSNTISDSSSPMNAATSSDPVTSVTTANHGSVATTAVPIGALEPTKL